MAINKKLIHFKNFETFNSLKLSANEENTKYTLGINGEVQDGSPDILYQSVVWIKDTQKQWTHGQMYNCSPLLDSGDGSKFLSDDGSYKTVESKFIKFSSNKLLKFYCIEPVTITINGEDIVYPANSSVSVTLLDSDDWTITPTSNSSISTLEAWPGTLGTFYPWLEGVNVFDSIVFDMNTEDMYTKWNQGNQGLYHVQFAQYKNCIFWSDLAYISDVAKRTNYTLYYSSELPLCYSTIPDNTFKAFYFAYNVTCDPNWSNPAYKESFANATWATQVFSYYGLHSIGMFDMNSSRFNITLPKDCRGLMYYAPNVLNAGVFDAINVTNFGAKSGSWKDAFGHCYQLTNLYIKNLKVNLNISWSPVNQQSMAFILENAANTNAITIWLSPHTYYGLTDANKTLAAEKNITLALIDTNTSEDNRLTMLQMSGDGNSYLANDGTYKEIAVPTKVSELEDDISIITLNDSTTIKESVDGTELVPIFDGENKAVSINELVKGGKEVYIIDLENYKTAEDFNNLKNAINSNKIICINNGINNEVVTGFEFGSVDGVEFVSFNTELRSYYSEEPPAFFIGCTAFKIWENGRYDIEYLGNPTEGDGTQFLSDDGTYKTISSSIPELESYYNPETKEFNAKGSDVDIIENNNFVILPLSWGNGSSGRTLNIVCETNITDSSSNLDTRYIKGSFVYKDEMYHIKLPMYKFDQTSIVMPEKYVSCYTFNYTEGKNSVTQDEYDGLKDAINNNNRIVINSDEGTIEPTIKAIDNNSIVLIYTKPGGVIIITIEDTLNLNIYDSEYVDSIAFNEELDFINDGITVLEKRIDTLDTLSPLYIDISNLSGSAITQEFYDSLSEAIDAGRPVVVGGAPNYTTQSAVVIRDTLEIGLIYLIMLVITNNVVTTVAYALRANTTPMLTKQWHMVSAGEGIEIDEDGTIRCALDTNPFIIVPNGVLPESGESGKIYLTPASLVGDQNVMIEYVWVNNAWEKFGEFATNIDLSDYALKSEVATKISDLENDKGYLVKVVLTQAEYDALETKDPNALYVISDANETEDNNFVTEAQLESRGFLTQTDRSELKEYDDFLLGKISDLEARLTTALERIATLESELENTLKV